MSENQDFFFIWPKEIAIFEKIYTQLNVMDKCLKYLLGHDIFPWGVEWIADHVHIGIV